MGNAKNVSLEALMEKAQVYYIRNEKNHPIGVAAIYKQKNGVVSRGIAIKSISEKYPDKEAAKELAIVRLSEAIAKKNNFEKITDVRLKANEDRVNGVLERLFNAFLSHENMDRIQSLIRFYEVADKKFETKKICYKAEYDVAPTKFEKELLKDWETRKIQKNVRITCACGCGAELYDSALKSYSYPGSMTSKDACDKFVPNKSNRCGKDEKEYSKMTWDAFKGLKKAVKK